MTQKETKKKCKKRNQ